MPATALLSTQTGQYLVVQAALPGVAPENIGVLLLDPAGNQLYMRFRRDWRDMADPEDAEVLDQIAERNHFRNIESALDLAQQSDRQQRVSTEFEEIGIDTDALYAQYFLPDLYQACFERRTRRDDHAGCLDTGPIRGRQRL